MPDDVVKNAAPEALLHEDPVIQARRWVLLGIMCLSLVMVVMSVSGLNVALPSLVRELHATTSQLQWVVDAYSLVFAALILAAGSLSDIVTIRAVGDCYAPGAIFNAVYAGHRLAREFDQDIDRDRVGYLRERVSPA